MASAAAVGADIARETSPNNFTEDTAVGPISSAILSKDEDVPDNLGEEDEDDDVIVPRAKRRGPAVNGDVGDASDGGDDDDLFGDGGDDDEEPPAKRQLDDEELDSGDDEGRHDRMASEDAQQDMEDRQETFMYVDFGRQPLPEPSDGEVCNTSPMTYHAPLTFT
ncbi:hypothetical protein M8818_006686 [Zalaria obscura]|uniref:Uncharacterized protein n=1 Tax=Zalaria obscura TaxID=2024903 RepID=A0ACC3S533_9PEZI